MGCCCFHPQQSHQIKQDSFQSISNSYISPSIDHSQQLKQQGNNHFNNHKYQLAIQCYTKAIIINPQKLLYYTNLALAYKNQKKYPQCIEAINKLLMKCKVCNEQIASKGKIIKARVLTIQVKQYLQSKQYSTKDNKLYQELIQNAIVLLRTIHDHSWDHETYLENATKVQLYMQQLSTKIHQNQVIITYLSNHLNGQNIPKNWSKLSQYFSHHTELLAELKRYTQNNLNEILHQHEINEQFITDPINYQQFINPIIVPSGITYQENILKSHWKNNGYNDPITHEQFKIGEQVSVRNLNLKQYITEQKHQLNISDILYLDY